MNKPHTIPHACEDCVNVHGDDAAAWLKKWPAGAEYRRRHRAHLCDGCADDRDDHDQAAAEDDRPDEYDVFFS